MWCFAKNLRFGKHAPLRMAFQQRRRRLDLKEPGRTTGELFLDNARSRDGAKRARDVSPGCEGRKRPCLQGNQAGRGACRSDLQGEADSASRSYVEISSQGELTLHLEDVVVEPDTAAPEERNPASRSTCLVPYTEKKGLVAYSDDESDGEGDDTGHFHDEFCSCADCRGVTSEERAVGLTPGGDSSVRSEADSAYWSESARSTASSVFASPRTSAERPEESRAQPTDRETSRSKPRSSEMPENSRAEPTEAEIKEAQKEERRRRNRALLDALLPPPHGPCCPKLQQKFDKLFALKKQGHNILEIIQNDRNFKNPLLLNNTVKMRNQGAVHYLNESGTHCKELTRMRERVRGVSYTRLDQGGESPERSTTFRDPW